jgi:hypothetical protein
VLKVDIIPEEITVYLEDGTEVVHWVEDEWKEDPSIVTSIANAIHLAHTDPDKLVTLNQAHIDSQRRLNETR